MTLSYDRSTNPKEIDLIKGFVEVDLYESIFEHTMSGSISIIDTFNLQDLLPLYGDEQIDLIFATQGNDGNPISYSGLVYKVSEKHRISEHSSGYTIYFMSHPAIQSETSIVQRGYEQTPSTIVRKIFDRINPKEVPLRVVDTTSVDKYSFGVVKPFQAISVLLKHSASTQQEIGYVFYQDNKQFNYVPLERLYKQDPVREYISRNKGIHENIDQRVQQAHSTIQDIRMLDENSYLDRISEGQHGSTALRYDLYSKSMERYEYNKEKNFDPEKSIGTKAFKKPMEVSCDSKIALRYDNKSPVALSTMQRNVMSKVELDTIRVEIVVFGDSTLRAGVCLLANLPIWNKDQRSVTDTLSGKFLISEIHHKLTNDDQYLQTMMLQKNAYEDL
jgi:hypothetical protein